MECAEDDRDKRSESDVREPVRMKNSPVTVTPHYNPDSVMDDYEQIENFEKEHG